MASSNDFETIQQTLQASNLPYDFTAYVQHIWAQGATDNAFQAFIHVAEILVGNIILTFPYSDEHKQYTDHYSSPTCPRPGLSSEELEAYYTERTERRKVVYPDLKRFADVDNSGFVTDQEGTDLRRIFECGLKVSHLVSLEGEDLDNLAGLVHMERSGCERCLVRYQDLLLALPDYVGTSLHLLPESILAQLPSEQA